MNTSWWHIDGAPTPDEWMALFSGFTLIAAIVAAAIALRQLRAHFETSRAQSRPYVIVDFAFKSILMQVEIKNIGSTAASELTLRVDPPFESGLREQATTLNAVFSGQEQISMLAPGRRILYTFDRAPDYHTAKRPERYTVTATYSDMPQQHRRSWRHGWRREVIQYTETYVLDFRQWSQATTESDYDNMNWNISKRQEKRTEKIVSSLASIAVFFERQRDGSQSRPVALDVVEQSELILGAAIEHPLHTPEPENETVSAEAGEELENGDKSTSDARLDDRTERGISNALP